ncbi:MAG TPA: hypothetical protein VF834_09200 [Streptosporangiaceae bacterium]
MSTAGTGGPGSGGVRRAPAAALASVTLASVAVLGGVGVPAKASPAGLPSGTITTVAGGAGGPALATLVPFYSPYTCGTVQYDRGHLYIGDQGGAVRAVSTRTDWLTTPAGVGQNGYSGDGGPASRAQLGVPCAAAIDYAGNLVIADKGNGRVRVVAATTGTFYGRHLIRGNIYTVMNGGAVCKVAAGSGSFCPVDVIADNSGNILVSNEGTEDPRSPSVTQIIVIAARSGTFYGRKMLAGKHYLLADGAGAQLAVDHAGNILAARGSRVTVLAERSGRFYGQAMRPGHVYVVAGTGTIGSSGDGGPARKAKLSNATGVAIDPSGNVVIGDSNANHVRVVAVATGTFYGRNMTAGDIYQIAGVRNGLTGNGVPAARAKVSSPHSITIDGSGNVVLCDAGSVARVIAVRTGTFYGKHMKAGDIYTVAGNRRGTPYAAEGGPATSAQGASGGIAIDRAGNLLIAAGRLRVVAGTTGTFYGKPMTAAHIYTIAGGGTGGLGDGGPAASARLGAADVAVDGAGNLVVTDRGNQRIRVVAAHSGMFYGRSMTAGDIYTVAGDGTAGFAGDGGPATSAELSDPQGVAVDQAGNLVLVDVGNSRVRVVAAATGTFYGQAMTAGRIYTVAGNGTCAFAGDGGPATSAELCFVNPDAVAIDASGNLVVADPENSRVRVVAASTGTFYGQFMTAGDIYTVAGNGATGSSGNGGPATSAELHYPEGVASDSHGNLIIGDSASEQVRVVAASTGTFYGVAMTAGDIYAVAGNGHFGLTGDDGPAVSAELANPAWVTVDGAGNLLFDDDSNGRIRKIAGH